MRYVKVNVPISREALNDLRAGDAVLLTGRIYTARDAAHKRLAALIVEGKPIPIELDGQAIYYVGPCVSDGKILSAGPTTSSRMDAYADLYDRGLALTIGKGERSDAVYDAIKRNKAAYLVGIGGAGAIYASAIKRWSTVAYEDLGTEAIYCFDVEDMPLIVAIDSLGHSIYR